MPSRAKFTLCTSLIAALLFTLTPLTQAQQVSSEALEKILAGGSPKNASELAAMQKRFQELSKKVLPATVGIRIGRASGSGVIISKDGYVMTAGHVSGAPGRDCVVILPSGKQLKAKTLGANRAIDSGLIKITDKGDYPFIPLGASTSLKRGQWVMATGHPGGFDPNRTAPVRIGRVLNNTPNGVMTDCMLVGGDSGGPLFDMQGRIIGINSRIGGTLMSNIHVPVDTYTKTMDRLKKGEAWGGRVVQGPRRNGPFIGVSGDPNARNAVISAVQPNGPAAKAGLKAGDIVTKLAGKKVTNFASLAAIVRTKKPGDKIDVEVTRGGKTVKLKLTIGKFGG